MPRGCLRVNHRPHSCYLSWVRATPAILSPDKGNRSIHTASAMRLSRGSVLGRAAFAACPPHEVLDVATDGRVHLLALVVVG